MKSSVEVLGMLHAMPTFNSSKPGLDCMVLIPVDREGKPIKELVVRYC